MTELDRRHYFLTEGEFALCCTAAGIDYICGFRFRQPNAFNQTAAVETVFAMVRRSLLRIEDGPFILSGELSDSFRTIRESERVLLIDRGHGPCCLLYGDGEAFVSLQPGERMEDYVCLARYRREELSEWLSDLSLIPACGIAEDLLESMEQGILPELEDRNLADYMARCLCSEAGEEEITPFPAGLAFCLECRQLSDRLLLGRAFLVRQPLFDRLMAWSRPGVTDRLCGVRVLTEFIENLWREDAER